jgi:hypothetical protein
MCPASSILTGGVLIVAHQLSVRWVRVLLVRLRARGDSALRHV